LRVEGEEEAFVADFAEHGGEEGEVVIGRGDGEVVVVGASELGEGTQGVGFVGREGAEENDRDRLCRE